MSRRKPEDKSADFQEFIQQTSDYLPPSTNKGNSTVSNTKKNQENDTNATKPTNPDKDKQSNKHKNSQTKTTKKKVYIGDLFKEPAEKEPIVNTTLQLPKSLNNRLKNFCKEFGLSKNEVVKTLVEALLKEKGF